MTTIHLRLYEKLKAIADIKSWAITWGERPELCPSCNEKLKQAKSVIPQYFTLYCPKCGYHTTGYRKLCIYCRARKLIKVPKKQPSPIGGIDPYFNWKCLKCKREFQIITDKKLEEIEALNRKWARRDRMLEELQKKYSKDFHSVEKSEFQKTLDEFRTERYNWFYRIKERYGIDLYHSHKVLSDQIDKEIREFKKSLEGKTKEELEEILKEEEKKIEELERGKEEILKKNE